MKVFLSQNILFKSNEEISEYLFQQCLDNLVATKENLDLATLLKIVQLFKESEDITFLGDEHDLDKFLTKPVYRYFSVAGFLYLYRGE